MAPEPTHLAWIDLETTGTNERRDAIIEVALILTDINLGMLTVDPDQKIEQRALPADAEYTWVIEPVIPLSTLMREMPPVVKEMHEANGLLKAIAADEGFPIHVVETRMLDVLDAFSVEPHACLLAGSGVGHFDKRFIEAQMPAFYKKMAYPVIDVGVMRRFLRDVCGAESLIPTDGDASTKTHRAFDDVRQHLREARHYQALFDPAIWEGK